ncbi:MAG: hypothetical protein K8F53_10175 [Rhodocyclaceae bacterium]|nr:hypothetical protein [Rhodocyclaceae bacterium]
MSGLYLLLVLGIWAGLTALIVKGWRRLLARDDVPKRRTHAVFVPLLACWLGVTFWYGGGRKVYYDAEVNRMCREDGGVKVYEQVKLPPEKFDKYGVVRIPSRQDAKPDDEYYYDNETTYLQIGNPSLRRSHTRVVMRSNGKVLGEAISYHRVGGDLPGPWHPSSFACPKPGDLGLEKGIFIRED